jgi:hypothetical protein
MTRDDARGQLRASATVAQQAEQLVAFAARECHRKITGRTI